MTNKLKEGEWSKKYKCCKICGTTEIPHTMLGFCKKCEAKEYHKNNKTIINLKHIIRYRLKKGLPCLQMIINDKTYYFPFAGLSKPKVPDGPKHEEYKRKSKIFDILKAHYERNKK